MEIADDTAAHTAATSVRKPFHAPASVAVSHVRSVVNTTVMEDHAADVAAVTACHVREIVSRNPFHAARRDPTSVARIGVNTPPKIVCHAPVIAPTTVVHTPCTADPKARIAS